MKRKVTSLVAALLLVESFGCNGAVKTVGDTSQDELVQQDDGVPFDLPPEFPIEVIDENVAPPPEVAGVDILVVVEHSGSMTAEQQLLKEAFPELIREILNPPINPVTGRREHEPVRDLHIGVVNPYMGVGGYPDIPSCEVNTERGDDGILQHTPLPGSVGCDPRYPPFLSYNIGPADEPNLAAVEDLATDFGCIAVLGNRGCGFEQQLEAADKALVVHTRPGGPNAGFLREDTILAVIFVSDEDDCSVEDLTFYDFQGFPHDLNLACYMRSDKLRDVNWYFQRLNSLRPDPNTLVVGFIVGVPPGVPECNGRGDRIGECNNRPEMRERIQREGPLAGRLLEFSCKYPPTCTPPDLRGNPGDCISESFPARRFVELAKLFGDRAVVQSICTGDFKPAVRAIADRISELLQAVQ